MKNRKSCLLIGVYFSLIFIFKFYSLARTEVYSEAPITFENGEALTEFIYVKFRLADVLRRFLH